MNQKEFFYSLENQNIFSTRSAKCSDMNPKYLYFNWESLHDGYYTPNYIESKDTIEVHIRSCVSNIKEQFVGFEISFVDKLIHFDDDDTFIEYNNLSEVILMIKDKISLHKIEEPYYLGDLFT